MAEEIKNTIAQNTENAASEEIITDVPKEQYTQQKFNLNTLVTKVPQKRQRTNLDSAFEVQDVIDDYALQRKELDDYEQDSDRRVVDYSYNANRTFSNTGTPLDGKTVDEIADSKNATPNQIFEMKDLLEQIAYGSYEVWRNLSKIGLWGGAKVAELVTGSDIELSEEEKLKGNPFDFGDSPEARSYAGMVAKPVTQFATGAALTGGVAGATGIKGAAAATKGLVKNAYGKKVLTGIFSLLQGMASDVVAFDENEGNFAELLNTVGVTVPDLLVKNPEDSFWGKKLKNSLDGAVFQMAVGALVGGAKVFKKVATRTGKAAIKEGEELVSVITKEGEKLVPKSEAQSIKPLLGDASAAADEATKTIPTNLIDEATQTVKGLSKEEKDSIVNKVLEDIAKEDVSETTERFTASELKKANKKQYENVVYFKEKEIAAEREISGLAEEVRTKFSAGDMSQAQRDKWVEENVVKLLENRSKTIEAASAPAQSVAEVSKSEAARRINKLKDYILDNADTINHDQMLDAIASLKSPEDFEAFFGTAQNMVRAGKVKDFFQKIAYVRQNIMLSSGATQLKDISSTLGHRMLELTDTTLAAGFEKLGKGYKKLKPLFSKSDEIAAKERIGMGAVDEVEFREVLDNITGMASFVQDSLRYAYRNFTKQLSANELNPITKHMKQVGEGLSKYNPKKQLNPKIIPGDSAFSNTLNNVFNHSGIWVAETKDDFFHAMFHNADIKTRVSSMVRRMVREGKISPADTEKEIKRYLQMAESYSSSEPQKVFDFANGLTDKARIDAIMKKAAQSSSKSVFRDELTGATGDLYRFIQAHPTLAIPLRIVAPFQKTGLTIGVERFLKERSIITPLMGGFQSAMARGGRDAKMALARLTNGLAIQAGVGYAMYNGSIIGPMPKNKAEREMLTSLGAKEYSARIGDKYYSLTDVAGPAGPAIKFALDVADFYVRSSEYAQDHEEYGFEDVAIGTSNLLGQMFFGTSFVGGLLENVERGDVLGLKGVINSLAAGPRAVQEVERIFGNLNDADYRKEAYDWMDRLSTNFGAEGHLKRDLYGTPMKASEISWAGMMSNEASNDAVTKEMLDRKAWVEIPGNTLEYDIGNHAVTIEISKEERNEWQRYMEEIGTYTKMGRFIKSSEYKRLPDSDYDRNGNPQTSKRKALVQKYNELKNEAKKKLIDNNTMIKLKLKEAGSTPIPSVNVNPYMDMIR